MGIELLSNEQTADLINDQGQPIGNDEAGDD